jgi:molybdopterin-guanine dinucleotide biosynthesis protein A
MIEPFESFILAGGLSRRMGTDKASLIIDEETLIQRAVTTLRKVSSSVTIVGRSSDDTRARVAPDLHANWGALGGLHAALSACQSDWAFVVACDLPFVTADLINHLASARVNQDAVVVIQRDQRPQPLCAFYRVDPCLARASELIESGHRRPLDLLESVNTRWIPFTELAHLDDSQNFFLNINTPEDYYEATQKAAAHKK